MSSKKTEPPTQDERITKLKADPRFKNLAPHDLQEVEEILEIVGDYTPSPKAKDLIGDPGKFQLEPFWAPYAYHVYLSGWSTTTSNGGEKVGVTEAMKAVWPALKKRKWVTIYEDSNGFCYVK